MMLQDKVKILVVGLMCSIYPVVSFSQAFSHLPIIQISTDDRIRNEPKVDGNIKIFHNEQGDTNSILDEPYIEASMGIEIRGKSSQNIFPKKGYGFEFRDADGADTLISIFNWPKAADWVIHSPYSDKSLMRNVLAYDLGRKMMDYAPRTQFVELFINERYYGVCVLTEKIEAREGRVSIDTESGGAIMKFDKTNGEEPLWTSFFTEDPQSETYSNVFLHDPKMEEASSAHQSTLQEFLQDFDLLMAGKWYDNPSTGYSNFIDLPSWIDFTLMNELSRNIDAYRISTYFYTKGSIDDRLFIGPIWDFNIAFGNANYCEGGSFTGWAWDFNDVCEEDSKLVHFWWRRILQDSSFQIALTDRWKELRRTHLSLSNIRKIIDQNAELLEGAQQRNFDRWEVLGEEVWPNNFVGDTYNEEVEYLKQWLVKRIEWMDQAISNQEFLPSNQPIVFRYQIRPNPTAEAFLFNFDSGDDVHTIRVKIHDPQGNQLHDSGDIETVETKTTYSWNAQQKGIYFARIEVNGRLLRVSKMVKI